MMKLFHDQSPRNLGTGLGSNSLPLDLQSDSHLLPDTLLTALPGPLFGEVYSRIYGQKFSFTATCL